MRSIARAALLAGLVVALAGCTPSFVTTPLPAPDKRLEDGCGHRPAASGEDARVVAKRFNIERRCEAAKREAWAGFYAGLQANRPGGETGR